MLARLSTLILHLLGWKTKAELPQFKKYVLIGAPHTSNWDFVYTMLGLSSIGLRFNWAMKHTLFFWPLGHFFRAIGGIPVDRSRGSAFLKSIIELFHQRDRLILAISPEGTRDRAEYWKTGFYLLAVKAGVPVVLGAIDYSRKEITVGQVLLPSGNIDQDMQVIAEFYADKTGRHPELQGPVALKNKTGY